MLFLGETYFSNDESSHEKKKNNIFSWGIKSQDKFQLQIVYNQTAIN